MEINSANFTAFLQVVQLLLSICIIPLLRTLSELRKSLDDLKLKVAERYVTKDDLRDVETKIERIAEARQGRRARAVG